MKSSELDYMKWWDYHAYIDLCDDVGHEPVKPEDWKECPLTCKLMLADHMEEIGLTERAQPIRSTQKDRLR